MALNVAQRRVLEDWMRSKAVVTCPCCRQDRWRFAEAAYLRALLAEGEEDLTEGSGVVKVLCGNCGYVALFDAQTLGIRGLWAKRGGTCSWSFVGNAPGARRHSGLYYGHLPRNTPSMQLAA